MSSYSFWAALISGGLFDLETVARVVFTDLEPEKVVDRVYRFRVVRVDQYTPACICLFELVLNLRLQSLHRRHSRWRLVMDLHGICKITAGKCSCDMRKVHTNLVLAHGIFWVLGGDFDRASIFSEQEVVRGLCLAEAHYVFAVMLHIVVGRAFWGLGRLNGWNLPHAVLGPCFLRKKGTRKCEEEGTNRCPKSTHF